MVSASLIIPYFNQRDSLQVILRSLEYQTGIDVDAVEVVIVNDGCKLERREELPACGGFRMVYAEHEHNMGRSAARNTGARVSSGDLLIFTDGDRFLSPTFLQEHIRSHAQQMNCVVIGDVVDLYCQDISQYMSSVPEMFYDPKHAIWRYARRYNYADCVLKVFDADGTTKSRVPWVALFSGNFSISRESFEAVHGFDESFKHWGFENTDLGYRLYRELGIFIYNSRAVNFHVYHHQQRSTTMHVSAHMLKSKWDGIREIRAFVDFVEGKTALQSIDQEEGSAQCGDEQAVYFSSSRLGPRYKWVAPTPSA